MNNNVAKKYAAILDRLYSKTINKSIKWELDGSRHPKAELGGYIIRLYNGMSGGNPMEYLSLSTGFDEGIEIVADDDLIDLSPSLGHTDSYYLLMEELRSQAFRQAIGADKALDDLLGTLDDDL